jgi:4-alpha-glucanotransferase
MESIEGTGLDERYNYKHVRHGRKSGVLCHISSLASPYGIGTFGDAAYDFVDFLVMGGQSCWQILPIGITGFGDSPYQSVSTKAGNPYFIDLDYLVRDGLLSHETVNEISFGNDLSKVDFGLLWEHRRCVLKRAWEAFNECEFSDLKEAFRSFQAQENDLWLHDFSLFMTIKAREQGRSWQLWPEVFRRRDPVALTQFEQQHGDTMLLEQFIQFLFFRQWDQLRAYATASKIEIIGDLPIYVAEDSVEAWLRPELFQFDEQLQPTLVAGCPPDYFSDDGQLWGNPLYDWGVHKKENYAWWIDRMQFQTRLFDTIRIDHFRGLESYWAVPYGDKTARRGHWVPGPAEALIDAIHDALGSVSVIAEDLGYMTEEVYAFRTYTGYPGMSVLQFAFNSDASSDYLPHNLTENTILYIGTHDNDTIKGWFQEADPEEIAFARRYLGLSEKEGLAHGMMRGAATSVCQTVIYQMQDLLGLDNDSRMNRPGTREGNWQWRMLPGELTLDLAGSLRELTQMSGRLPGER